MTLAQLVERQINNLWVTGSNPVRYLFFLVLYYTPKGEEKNEQSTKQVANVC